MDVGLPFGPKPRLVLYHLNAELGPMMRAMEFLLVALKTGQDVIYAGVPDSSSSGAFSVSGLILSPRCSWPTYSFTGSHADILIIYGNL